MSGPLKVTLVILGAIAALLMISQFALGMMILGDPGSPALRKSHQHSGYLTALVTLIYIIWSMIVIVSRPKPPIV